MCFTVFYEATQTEEEPRYWNETPPSDSPALKSPEFCDFFFLWKNNFILSKKSVFEGCETSLAVSMSIKSCTTVYFGRKIPGVKAIKLLSHRLWRPGKISWSVCHSQLFINGMFMMFVKYPNLYQSMVNLPRSPSRCPVTRVIKY